MNCKIEINIEDFRNILENPLIDSYYKYSIEGYVDTHADEV